MRRLLRKRTVYDRRHGAVLASDVAQYLASRSALERGAALQVGGCTGRVAVAVASCPVIGIDSGAIASLAIDAVVLAILLQRCT